MPNSIDVILDDLRSFVAGRGSEDNFLWSKFQAHVPCADFSPWFGMRLLKNDTFALGVFNAQLRRSNSQFEEVNRYNLADDGDELVEEEILEEVDNSSTAFEHEVNFHEQIIKNAIQFKFEEYFVNDIRIAKMDLLIAWLFSYSSEGFAKVMMPYNLRLKNANSYLEEYNKRKKKQLQMPADLPNDPKFNEFQRELRKLPLATRLHTFDIFEYSGFGKTQSKKPLSKMTLLGTRRMGIDEVASAKILNQSKLITSFPDGTGIVSPEFIGSISSASDYAKKIDPVYYEWRNEVASLISNKLLVSSYANDPKDDKFFGEEILKDL